MPPKVSQAVQVAIKEGTRLGIIQEIQNLRVAPRVQVVWAGFETTQPTVPIIEVLKDHQDPPGQQFVEQIDAKFPIFGGKQMVHKYWLGERRRLNQGTEYILAVTAPATQFMGANPHPAHTSRTFMTLRRRCVITIDNIRVRNDGDPGGTGEMEWAFAVYDGETRARLTEPQFYQNDDAGDGDNLFVHIVFTIDYAPDSLILYAFGIDWDRDIIPLPGQGLNAIGIRPPDRAPDEAQTGDPDAGEWAEGLFEFDVPDWPIGKRQFQYTLASKWGGVSYYVDFRFDTEIWSVAPPVRKHAFSSPSLARVGTTAHIGDAAVAHSSAGKKHMVALGPDERLLYASASADLRGEGHHDWQQIGTHWDSPVTTLASADGCLWLATLDREGAVRVKHLPGDAALPEADSPWETLGGAMTGALVGAVSEDGRMHLVGQDREGGLQHALLGDRKPGDAENGFTRIDTPSGTLCGAVAARDGTLHLLLEREGHQLAHRAWNPARPDDESGWTELGETFGGPVLFVGDEEDRVAVLTLDPEENAFYKEWQDGRWTPEGRDWEKGGSVHRMIEELNSTPEDDL